MTTTDKQQIAELGKTTGRLVFVIVFIGIVLLAMMGIIIAYEVKLGTYESQICLPEKTQFFNSLDGRFAGVVLNMSDPKEAYIAKQFQQVIVNLNKIQLVPQYTSNQQPQGGAP